AHVRQATRARYSPAAAATRITSVFCIVMSVLPKPFWRKEIPVIQVRALAARLQERFGSVGGRGSRPLLAYPPTAGVSHARPRPSGGASTVDLRRGPEHSNSRPRSKGVVMTTEAAPQLVRCRGIRGATFVPEDTPEAILAATRELLAALVAANGIATEDVASAF